MGFPQDMGFRSRTTFAVEIQVRDPMPYGKIFGYDPDADDLQLRDCVFRNRPTTNWRARGGGFTLSNSEGFGHFERTLDAVVARRRGRILSLQFTITFYADSTQGGGGGNAAIGRQAGRQAQWKG